MYLKIFRKRQKNPKNGQHGNPDWYITWLRMPGIARIWIILHSLTQ